MEYEHPVKVRPVPWLPKFSKVIETQVLYWLGTEKRFIIDTEI